MKYQCPEERAAPFCIEHFLFLPSANKPSSYVDEMILLQWTWLIQHKAVYGGCRWPVDPFRCVLILHRPSEVVKQEWFLFCPNMLWNVCSKEGRSQSELSWLDDLKCPARQTVSFLSGLNKVKDGERSKTSFTIASQGGGTTDEQLTSVFTSAEPPDSFIVEFKMMLKYVFKCIKSVISGIFLNKSRVLSALIFANLTLLCISKNCA